MTSSRRRQASSRPRATRSSRSARATCVDAGQIENWQAQHPPLYYYLLAPVYLATKSLSFAGQLFALRAFSCLIAWIGLLVTAVAALRGKYRSAPRCR